MSESYQGRAIIGKMDVDTNSKYINYYNVRHLPTLLYFKNGKAVDYQIGYKPQQVLEQKLNALL